MSEVKRYGHISYLVEATPQILSLYPAMTVYVLSSDFDAAQSELAALREELLRLEEEYDTLEHANIKLKLNLAAAEQRNSQMIFVPRHLLMRASHSICRGNDLKELRTFLAGVPKECNTCDDRKLVCLDFEMGEWLDCPSCSKPTESGASEPACCDRFPKCVCYEGADGL